MSPLSIRNQIVLVPFPFDDLTSTKVRPVLCLTGEIDPHHHVVVAFITSQVPASPSPTDIVLRPEDPNFSLTGLRATSAIRLHRLMTASSEIFRRVLGTLPDKHAAQIRKGLRELFDL